MNLQTAALAATAEVARIGAEIAALQEAAKKARQDAIGPFLEALAASGEVSVIVVRGYTPGFNDGDPCEHSSDVFVNIKQLHDNEMLEYDEYDLGLPDDLHENLEPEHQWVRRDGGHLRDEIEGARQRNIDRCAQLGHIYAQPSSEVMKAITDLIFATAEEDRGTNYFVTYILKNGKFEVSSGEYDCGH